MRKKIVLKELNHMLTFAKLCAAKADNDHNVQAADRLEMKHHFQSHAEALQIAIICVESHYAEI